MQRLSCITCSTAVMLCLRRFGATAGAGSSEPAAMLGIAPKRQRRRPLSKLDVSGLVQNASDELGAHAELSTAELERKVEAWSKMNPRELEDAVKRFETQEQESGRVLAEDSLYQMDVSLKSRSQAAVRVFWEDVDVEALGEEYSGWYTVTVDRRRVKAFESKQVLAVPSEAMAYCCANEYAEQKGHLNKLLMPLTDLCSGALHLAPQMIDPRVDYLVSFYQNDNLYHRAAPVAALQDTLIAPIATWFEREFAVALPRVMGIANPRLPPRAAMQMRDHLLSLSMNPYQVLSLCVAAQYTSSLLLPLALFHGVVDLPTALKINRAEEGHNIAEAGLIEGYHDIREADVATKLSACAVTWKLMREVPLSKCLEAPRATPMDAMDGVL